MQASVCITKGDVLGHQDSIKDAVGQQLLQVGIKQTCPMHSDMFANWGMHITTFMPTDRGMQQVIQGLHKLSCKLSLQPEIFLVETENDTVVTVLN